MADKKEKKEEKKTYHLWHLRNNFICTGDSGRYNNLQELIKHNPVEAVYGWSWTLDSDYKDIEHKEYEVLQVMDENGNVGDCKIAREDEHIVIEYLKPKFNEVELLQILNDKIIQ